MKPPLEHSHSLPQTPAIVNERHRKIIALLHQQTSLSVSQLAHMLGVSEVTIRKDLTLLEQQQMLYRVHGSAILANPYIQERHVNDKEKLCSDQKRAIGAYAARLVEPRDTILIASGTTTLAMAREIREVNSSGEAERILSWLSETKGVGFITLADPRYPRLMIEAGAAPVLLWYRGDAGLLARPVLTVGGSTHPDREALYNAEVFGEALGTRNELLLSTGHFPGTETVFLASVLRTGGRALVWQPCGPDRVWPSEGRDLLHELLDKGGLIMTAVAPGFGFSPEGRELQTCCRMASAQALLALNAGTGSHLFSLARTAADWGRDVMAVPGSIHSPFARGCHRLIRQGARLVESSDDILAELRLAGS